LIVLASSRAAQVRFTPARYAGRALLGSEETQLTVAPGETVTVDFELEAIGPPPQS
jgi:hypothetical protein